MNRIHCTLLQKYVFRQLEQSFGLQKYTRKHIVLWDIVKHIILARLLKKDVPYAKLNLKKNAQFINSVVRAAESKQAELVVMTQWLCLCNSI